MRTSTPYAFGILERALLYYGGLDYITSVSCTLFKSQLEIGGVSLGDAHLNGNMWAGS